LRLLCTDPEQEAYALVRPVVLFGRSPAQRAKETGVSERTIRCKAERFDTSGMASLFGEPPQPRRVLPPEIWQAILELKAQYPAFHLRELADICQL
jgi:transposase